MWIIPNPTHAHPAARTGLAQLLVVVIGIACGAVLLLAASWPDDRTRRVLAWFPGDSAGAGALGAITRAGGLPLLSRLDGQLWLVELPHTGARARLRAAGAWLVLDGSRFAGCVPAAAPRNSTLGDIR